MVNVVMGNYNSELRKIKFITENEKKGKRTVTHIKNIISFDIETSSGYLQDDGNVIAFNHDFWEKNYKNGKINEYKNKVSMMYIWQCAIENKNDINVFIGRTWDDFKEFLCALDDVISDFIIFKSAKISDDLFKSMIIGTGKYKRPTLHFYVHNLGFEFQFLRNVLDNIKDVFARNMRKPMKFSSKLNNVDIMFHDTLCLTQKSLANWAKDENLSIKKLVGDLDYLIIRNTHTTLTQQELDYCINDVALMIEGMKKYRDKYKHIYSIPMTQTGEVRLMCQEKISKVNNEWAEKCYEIDHSYSYDFFNRLLTAFAGGWTHANEKYSGKLQGNKVKGKNIVCYDFASSYPSVMTTCKFPVSQFREIDNQRLSYLETLSLDDSDYRYMIVVELFDVESKTWNSFFSVSKCIDIDEKTTIVDNGKIVATDYMKVCITDTDWDIIKKVYDFSSYNILEVYEADADYLPFEFIDVILKYFEDKTALKGTGNHSAYTAAKQFINSLYGCCVTKIITDEISYNETWAKHSVTEEDFNKLMEYPDTQAKMMREISKKFTTYQIGVWIPAFARHRLWDAIIQFDSKTVYCDTDSIKGYFDDIDIKWFDKYNDYISSLQEKVANHYKFNVDRFIPLSSKNEKKQLGIFEREEDCVDFKALRAKVYAAKHVDENGVESVETTIAGLPKKSGLKLIKEVDDLNDGLFWTTKLSDKLCCNYLDNQPSATWTDEQGNTEICDDKYGIMLEPISFDLSIASEYEYLLKVLEKSSDVDYFDTPEILRNYWGGERNVKN